MKKPAFKKYVILAVIVLWGLATFLLLCGEEAPGTQMSLTSFIIIKVVALASLYLCYKSCKKAEREHMLPDFWYK